MSKPVLVHMIGAPIACSDGVKDSWRGVAQWLTGQLKGHFGEDVQVQYFDLFDTECPPLPDQVQLPVVLINGQVTISGGKISVPDLRRKIGDILESQMD